MEIYKTRVIKRETLCQNISARCNYVDPAVVNQVYTGLIKTIMDDIRTYGGSYLPDWGIFRITEIKPHKIGALRTGAKTIIEKTKRLKFTPCNQLKYYVKNKL